MLNFLAENFLSISVSLDFTVGRLKIYRRETKISFSAYTLILQYPVFLVYLFWNWNSNSFTSKRGEAVSANHHDGMTMAEGDKKKFGDNSPLHYGNIDQQVGGICDL